MKIKKRCGKCDGCQIKNCGICLYCLDMRRFGGKGIKKQACMQRVCTLLRIGHNLLNKKDNGQQYLDLTSKESRQDSTSNRTITHSVQAINSRSQTNDNKEVKICKNKKKVGSSINGGGELLKHTEYQDNIEINIKGYQKVSDKPSLKSQKSMKNDQHNHHSKINKNMENKS